MASNRIFHFSIAFQMFSKERQNFIFNRPFKVHEFLMSIKSIRSCGSDRKINVTAYLNNLSEKCC
jgi:hypothetical protein